MILELLPRPIKLLYIKMQLALSMRGFLDALRELLDELEWNADTSKTFQMFLSKFRAQEKADTKRFEDSIKFVNAQFKAIQKGEWNNESVRKMILEEVLLSLSEIEEGKMELTNYLKAKISLLEQVAKLMAAYGEFDILKSMGRTQMLSISFPRDVDPLKIAVKEHRMIYPFTEDGNCISIELNNGFVKANVYPPTDMCKTNRYYIDQGWIFFEWPDFVKKSLAISYEDWRISFDISATRCLHYLLCVAGWQEWDAVDKVLHENPSDKELNWFYNSKTMRRYISKILRDPNQQQVRNEIMAVLDRLLIVIVHEKGENKGKRNNKERAEKHAYIKIKSILLPLEPEERMNYNTDQVIGMVMDDIQFQDLNFTITRTHCKEACRKFTATHGWQKKRGPDKKSREKRAISNQRN